MQRMGRAVNRGLARLGLQMVRSNRVEPIVGTQYPDVQRFLYFYRLFQRIEGLDGDVVECGVWRGRSLLWLSIFAREEQRGRKVWGFDTFEGFPAPTGEDQSTRRVESGELSDTSIPYVSNLLLRAGLDRPFVTSQITLIQGLFQASLSKYRGEGIAFLNLDVDLHDSYRTCLEQLYPRVVPGGVVVFDEYLNTKEHIKFPGAQRAIDEYLGQDVSLIQRDAATGKYFLVKPRA